MENERTMVFYNVARMDGLAKRVETPTEMTEHFVDRDDFLYYKHTTFGRRPKMFGPQDGATTVAPRPIVVSRVLFVLCVCVEGVGGGGGRACVCVGGGGGMCVEGRHVCVCVCVCDLSLCDVHFFKKRRKMVVVGG